MLYRKLAWGEAKFNVVEKEVMKGHRPAFDSDPKVRFSVKRYKGVLERCWDQRFEVRPVFREVEQSIGALGL